MGAAPNPKCRRRRAEPAPPPSYPLRKRARPTGQAGQGSAPCRPPPPRGLAGRSERRSGHDPPLRPAQAPKSRPAPQAKSEQGRKEREKEREREQRRREREARKEEAGHRNPQKGLAREAEEARRRRRGQARATPSPTGPNPHSVAGARDGYLLPRTDRDRKLAARRDRESRRSNRARAEVGEKSSRRKPGNSGAITATGGARQVGIDHDIVSARPAFE